MNLPFFDVEAYVPGGGGARIRPTKKKRKIPSGRYRYKNLLFQWETNFLRLLALTSRGAVPINTSFGNSFPGNARAVPEMITSTGVKFLLFSTVLVISQAPNHGDHPFTSLLSDPPKGAGKLVPREKYRKIAKSFLTLFDDF